MSSKDIEAALKRGQARSSEIERKVLAAMATIEAEMKANGGVYPANGGAVSKNEVARRAEISPSTLFSPKQRALGDRVLQWVEDLEQKAGTGRMRVQRTYAQRAEDWKTEYHAVVDNYRKAELLLQSAQAERDEALALVDKLKADNAVLLEQLQMASASKVAAIPKRKN
jgi:hypothetical protein